MDRMTQGDAGAPRREREIRIRTGEVELCGTLGMPERARGLVLFAHGAGSSRYSPRNRFVAEVMHRAEIGTLLLDLLTEEEEADRANVFDIGLLAHRLVEATRWLRDRMPDVRVGYFGASTGAGAALAAAARLPDEIDAVVSRGGRPDLAGADLAAVRAPTLLIVGGDDDPVIELNRSAFDKISGEKDLVIVPGATHLFEEPGTLEQVAALAVDWFGRFLGGNAEERRAA